MSKKNKEPTQEEIEAFQEEQLAKEDFENRLMRAEHLIDCIYENMNAFYLCDFYGTVPDDEFETLSNITRDFGVEYITRMRAELIKLKVDHGSSVGRESCKEVHAMIDNLFAGGEDAEEADTGSEDPEEDDTEA